MSQSVLSDWKTTDADKRLPLGKRVAPTLIPFDVEDDVGGTDVTHLIGILDLKAHHCRYIHGDPKAAHGYCGAQVKPSSSYCPEHHARVYPGVRP